MTHEKLIPFSKYSGCGNDFVIIDHRIPFLPIKDPLFFSRLCHRQKGIGADGVLLLELSRSSNFKMRIFNADGSEAEMCGNGLRCFTKFIQNFSLSDSSFLVQVSDHSLKCRVLDGQVETEIPLPEDIRWKQKIEIEGKEIELHFIDTGVPHVILFQESLENLEEDFVSLARKIRFHPAFSPKGTNVTYIENREKNTLSIKTFERGVENITLACATGGAAAAFAAYTLFSLPSPLFVKTPSRDLICYDFDVFAGEIGEIRQKGKAEFLFSGHFYLSSFTKSDLTIEKDPSYAN